MVRLIVNIVSGPGLGRKVVLEPDGELTIGRAQRADVTIADDAEMAGLHLVLSGTETGYRLRDLNSVSGTWLNGEQVQETDLANAAWVRAGSTELLLCHEGRAAAHALKAAEDDSEKAAQAQRALETLRAPGEPLYAVLDAARDIWVLQLLRESVDEVRCLFDPPESQTLFMVAPYVVQLEGESKLLDHLVKLGWGQSWGVFLRYERPFTRLRQHLVRVFDSIDPETEKPAYFRFFDPRVLRRHIPSCTVKDRARLFGDIPCFFAETEDGELGRFDRPEPASE